MSPDDVYQVGIEHRSRALGDGFLVDPAFVGTTAAVVRDAGPVVELRASGRGGPAGSGIGAGETVAAETVAAEVVEVLGEDGLALLEVAAPGFAVLPSPSGPGPDHPLAVVTAAEAALAGHSPAPPSSTTPFPAPGADAAARVLGRHHPLTVVLAAAARPEGDDLARVSAQAALVLGIGHSATRMLDERLRACRRTGFTAVPTPIAPPTPSGPTPLP